MGFPIAIFWEDRPPKTSTKSLSLLVSGARLGQPCETVAVIHSAPLGSIGRLAHPPNPVCPLPAVPGIR
jgi:hypothetical protein